MAIFNRAWPFDSWGMVKNCEKRNLKNGNFTGVVHHLWRKTHVVMASYEGKPMLSWVLEFRFWEMIFYRWFANQFSNTILLFLRSEPEVLARYSKQIYNWYTVISFRYLLPSFWGRVVIKRPNSCLFLRVF